MAMPRPRGGEIGFGGAAAPWAPAGSRRLEAFWARDLAKVAGGKGGRAGGGKGGRGYPAGLALGAQVLKPMSGF